MVQKPNVTDLTAYKLEKLTKQKEELEEELKYNEVLMATSKALIDTLDPLNAQSQVYKLVEYLCESFNL